jgi:hypothetical protein
MGGGVQGNCTGTNNIIYTNFASTYPEIYEGYFMLTYTCCATTISGTGNITSNPLFVDPDNSNFHLQTGSPCIDTGNPSWSLDPDSTRADMGAWYFDHLSPPTVLEVTLTPINPPIQIPATGGSFNFTISLQRTQAPQAPYAAWARIKNPNGTYTPPTLGPVTINTPVGLTVTRQRSQSVPASWAAGVYSYLGYVNPTYAYPVVDSSFFAFTKLADGTGPYMWEASCLGDPFPGEVISNPQPLSIKLRGASPNPFNPTTVISYQLSASGQISLRVYDISGRLVTTLMNGWKEAGIHEVTFDGFGLASGIYLYALTSGNRTLTEKMVLIK